MYQEFYQFKEPPFNVTCDPEFFFSSTRHSEAFSHLIYGIKQRKGILVITGEIGTGKTTLLRTLMNRFDDDIISALVLNPTFSEIQLLQLVVSDLGINTKAKNKLGLISALNDFLLKQSSLGKNIVLIIDESQNLKERQLEQIRLLSNLETEKYKLLQIILLGQPELLNKLKLNSLRQLNQRVSVKYHILPLQPDEVPKYIEHRIRVARSTRNGTLPVHFTKEAFEAIINFSNCVPRLINIVCDRALLYGYVHETRIIEQHVIEECTQEIVL